MQRTLWILIAGCGLLCATTPVAGHHAFGAEFDPDARSGCRARSSSSSGSTRMPGSISK